ncbi:MAG TPA: hypothetical protein EYM73_01095 [Dehalococcoidia bacterium]|nr:hypothetical protein [Dehalococcoidia bacterium]
MNTKKLKLTGLLLAVGLIAIIAGAACSGGDPQELDIEVSIDHGLMNPETIEVIQGDMVTLKILANEGGEFHLHTYDIEMDIEAGSETDFFFVAEATGRFKITYHPQGESEHNEEEKEGEEEHDQQDEAGEIEVGFLEVQPR